MIKLNSLKIITLLSSFVALYYFSPYKIDFLGYYKTKIGAHQCNSVRKLKSALLFFDRIELDLVYKKEDNILDIYHSPSPSTGLSLKTYLESIPENKFPFIWLDFKNLNTKNNKLIFERVHNLLTSKSYPLKQILIESKNPEALEIFIQNNYITSYYLPNNLFKLNENEIKNKISKIEEVLNDNPKLNLSFRHENYEIVKKYFPYQKKYIWSLTRIINPYFFKTRNILKDESVEIVLINYKNI